MSTAENGQSTEVETRRPRSGALDAVLGGRVRRLRKEQGLSQTALGERIGITFQQVQKYENGSNRISALTLLKLAAALNVSPGDLLADLDPAVDSRMAATPGATKLVHDFSRIRSHELREVVLKLAASLAEI